MGSSPPASSSQPTTSLAEWLREGPYTLALASSFFGYYAHTGVLQALEEVGILPAKVCGSSSGAIVGTLWGCGLDARTSIKDLVLRLRREDILLPFWQRPGPGFFQINEAFLEAHAPVKDIALARVPVAISTYDVLAGTTRVWTSGPPHKLVAASCCIPVFMQTVWIDGRPYFDGGVRDLLGLASCAPEERVLSVDLNTNGRTAGRSIHRALLGSQDNRRQLDGCVKLQLHGLTRLGPTSMDQGAAAMEHARAVMRLALQERRSAWGKEEVVAVRLPDGEVQPAVPAAEPEPLASPRRSSRLAAAAH